MRVRIHEVVALKLHASAFEFLYGCIDVSDFPPKHGVLRRSEVLHFAYAEHDSIGIEYERKAIIVDEREAQFGGEEFSRLVRLTCKEKAHHLVELQHGHSLVEEWRPPILFALDRLV